MSTHSSQPLVAALAGEASPKGRADGPLPEQARSRYAPGALGWPGLESEIASHGLGWPEVSRETSSEVVSVIVPVGAAHESAGTVLGARDCPEAGKSFDGTPSVSTSSASVTPSALAPAGAFPVPSGVTSPVPVAHTPAVPLAHTPATPPVPLSRPAFVAASREPGARVVDDLIGTIDRSATRRALPAPAEPRIMVVANQKGGVGKTTTTVNIAAALAQQGLRLLVVDLDPQGNASTALSIPHDEGMPSTYEVLIEGADFADVITECPDVPGLLVAPATIDLAGAEIELVPMVAREGRLRRALDAHLEATSMAGQRYDFVLIDCPPSLGLLTVNALTAGREMLVPIQCEYYALEGLTQLMRTISQVREHLNPPLSVGAVVLTMYDGRTRLAAQVAAEVRQHFGAQVLKTAIPRTVRISEAPSHGQTVLTYDPGSPGALSYLEAAIELATQHGGGV